MARSSVVAGGPGGGRRWCGCRRRCTARRPSGRRTRRPGRRRRPGGRGCRRSPAGPPPRRRRGAGRRPARRRPAPTQATRPSSIDQRRVVAQPERPVAVRRTLVTSSPMLSTSRLLIAVTTPIAAAQRAPATSTSDRCRPSATTCRPSTTTWVTSAAPAAKSAPAGGTPAVRTLSRPTVTRSARSPGGDAPGVGPAQRRVPGDGGGGQQLGGGEGAAACGCAAARPAPAPRASSNRSITAWLSLPRLSGLPASASSAGRPDPVGQVPFGGRAEADAGPAVAEQAYVRAGQVGGVHGRRARPEQPGVGEQRRSGCARAPPGRPRSRRAARTGARAAAPPVRRPSRRRPASCSAGTARTECTAAPTRACAPCGAKSAARCAQRVRVAVAEAPLRPGQRRRRPRRRSGSRCRAG